jgi:hypothetical protein
MSEQAAFGHLGVGSEAAEREAGQAFGTQRIETERQQSGARRGAFLAHFLKVKYDRSCYFVNIDRNPRRGASTACTPGGLKVDVIDNRGKTRGGQGGRGWMATNSGRYGMAGLPGTASLEPR